MKCIICKNRLVKKQTKFCSTKCKNKSTNCRNQNYAAQQKRGLERKIKLVKQAGGKCSLCPYAKNYAALAFHHLDPSTKCFQLDLRSCSNHSWEVLLEEAAKCQLLCTNCHLELHNPTMAI